MKALQALLPLLPLSSYFNYSSPLDNNPITLCTPKVTTFTNTTLSEGIDFSKPAIGQILSNTGSSTVSPASGSTHGRFSRGGRAQELRVHRYHSRHASTKPREQACPQPPVLSCSDQADATDSCCVVRPGGALVHVQLWDVGIGETDSFGIHGLWPDKCDGTYYENCDHSRAYSSSIISSQLPSDLRSFMGTYWQSNDESPENFWYHEWKTHGTCVSTLEPSCLSGYQQATEVVPYFETVVALFKQLDTYQALTNAGITPSSSVTYSASSMQEAIASGTGYTPDLVCTHGALTSVQFYVNARGPLQDGVFEESEPTRESSCPDQISWPPKTT